MMSIVGFLMYPAADGISNGPTSTNLLDGYTVSATFNSAPEFVGNVTGYVCAVTVVSGSVSAVVKLQGCIDPNTGGNLMEPSGKLVNWVDLPFFDNNNLPFVSQTLSGAGTVWFSADVCNYQWFRLVWTHTSGTPVVTARVSIKRIGG